MVEEMRSVSAVNNLRAAEFISFNPPPTKLDLSPALLDEERTAWRGEVPGPMPWDWKVAQLGFDSRALKF